MNEKTLRDLNNEQKEAVTLEEGPALIVAGAGTGKTTVITKRIGWLIETGKAKPEEILAVTFTDKAAQEMEERVDRLLPYSYLNLEISTFHAFCDKILREHGIEIGLSTDFKVLSGTDGWLLVRENLNKFNLDYYRPLGNPTKFIHALIKHFGRAKDEEVWPEDYLKYVQELKLNKDASPEDGDVENEVKRLEEVAGAYHVYQKLLLDNNSLDFGDLINYALRLFRQRPKILEYHRRRYKYILVDEFQDTNWAQYELIKLLAAPKNNVMVVADDDQSIYKFRGASVSNVLEFKKDYPQAKEIMLVNNYRSPQNLLDLTYKFIRLNDPNRLEYQLAHGSTGSPLKTKLSKRLIAPHSEPAVIEHVAAKTDIEEARNVVEKIVELQEKKRLTWDDFAILVRANNSAEPFLAELERRGVPYQFIASRGLYAKPIVLDILAYLRLLDNYHESASLYRVLNLPCLNFSPGEIVEMTHLSRVKSWSLYETLKKAAGDAKTRSELLEKIEFLLDRVDKHSIIAKEKNVGAVVYAFLEDLGYLKHVIRAISEKSQADALNYLNQFYKKIEHFERQSPDKSLRTFIKRMDLIIEAGDEGGLETDIEAGPETVKVLTVHGAKGLEFSYIFVVNLVDRRFPTIERKEQIELPKPLIKEIIPEGDIHLEEERRLFYVACTRAKKGLFLTSAEDYGGARKKKPSRFLSEIGFVKEEPSAEKKKGAREAFEERMKEKPPAREKAEKQSFIIPSEFSFSQFKALETCPWQYRFAHVLKIPVKGRASFSFGKSVHAALQKFFQLILEQANKTQTELFNGSQKSNPAATPSLDELLKFYEQSWIDEWYESKERQNEYKENGKKMLKEFYEADKENWPRVRYIERGFKWKISDPDSGEIYPITGKIDRIDVLPDGSFEIIDYKTGKPADAKKGIDKNQLLLYQKAAQEILKKPVSKLTYYYLENASKISFTGNEKDFQKLEKEILEQIGQIKKGGFAPAPDPFKCRYCDFKEICEFREL
ncbi:hypothetical protein A2W60_02480 [Candidatus Azambacteria bacterium RIFCSPHIGHO2_02_46_12]|uniref:DNA 3'-5' helicase n=1 Tax=Candidatus Azambacteria bacterium RIFCSPHIGHO2_02_46_12 TaxID=1797295 RepID=A0A1F5BKG7_9BACT|nr:MAG: hypothetical protein A2W60_02480 [Candidatus Azambacteria bacterium RIFCSPHIGHO2_02_46_12]